MCGQCFATSGLPDQDLGELELKPPSPPCTCPCEPIHLTPTGDKVWFRCTTCAPHAVRIAAPSTDGGAEFPGQ